MFFIKILKQVSQLAVMSVLTTSAHAVDWPVQPVKIITNLPVGSRPDVVFRLTAEELSAKWKQPVTIENRPGGGGLVSLNEFNQESARSNHVILAVDSAAVITAPILTNREDSTKLIAPIALSYLGEMVVVASSKYTNEQALAEFRKRPIFGSWAVGSVGHFCGLELASAISQNTAEHVPYKEYGVWYTDLHNQAFPLSCSSYGSAVNMIDSGKLRVVAVTSEKRNPKLPQVPTFRELTGRDTKFVTSLLGYFVATNLDKNIANKIERDLIAASESVKVQQAIEAGHGTPKAVDSKEFSKMLADIKKISDQVIQKHQIKIN